MAGDPRSGDANFLRRWSQRKRAAARQATAQEHDAPPGSAAEAPTLVGAAGTAPATSPVAAAGTPPPAGAAAPSPPLREDGSELPPVESLGFDSDFTRFLAPKVDETVKRKALRKLFSDPRFNVMDGLDVYIDDYSKFEPIPDDLLGKLRHARYVFDPPKTRVNEAGHVEDVPDEPEAGTAAAVERDSATTATAGPAPQLPAAATDLPPPAEVPRPGQPEPRAVVADETAATGDAPMRDEKR
jgi:hypothetical protein